MKLKIYQVDAFTDKVFGGNPAAICPLAHWIDDTLMQQIAMENNLAETAFIVKDKDQFTIRWFTPAVEVDLCGHATLASAYVLFNHEGYEKDTINFYSPRSGALTVTRQAENLTMNFPADEVNPIELTDELLAPFKIAPEAAFKGKTDFMFVFKTEEQIQALKPDLQKIESLQARGVIVTARGKDVDFVSRFFAPQSGINEDPVTGSAHTTLIPYWSKILGKDEMSALQLSPRGGVLYCRNIQNRVEISGQAKLYMIGDIFI